MQTFVALMRVCLVVNVPGSGSIDTRRSLCRDHAMCTIFHNVIPNTTPMPRAYHCRLHPLNTSLPGLTHLGMGLPLAPCIFQPYLIPTKIYNLTVSVP